MNYLQLQLQTMGLCILQLNSTKKQKKLETKTTESEKLTKELETKTAEGEKLTKELETKTAESEKLQDELKLTYLFISHDLSVIEHICDRVAIMYLGKVVEIGTKEDIFNNPQHPYTKALLSAIPKVGKRDRSDRIILEGDIPSPVNPPAGCRFHTRCPYATEQCKSAPPVVDFGNGHKVACHLCAGTNK